MIPPKVPKNSGLELTNFNTPIPDQTQSTDIGKLQSRNVSQLNPAQSSNVAHVAGKVPIPTNPTDTNKATIAAVPAKASEKGLMATLITFLKGFIAYCAMTPLNEAQQKIVDYVKNLLDSPKKEKFVNPEKTMREVEERIHQHFNDPQLKANARQTLNQIIGHGDSHIAEDVQAKRKTDR